ncbi:unannotated protein [freshwater metagenome]|uniref:NAD(+) synthase (glutamine-hydrolyzing) n=1 Tax=freshwater metagenome TaxID=449393 RepID=A0A6J7E3P6_9ZZZZ
MSQGIQVALCQINPTVGDLRGNAQLILEAANAVADADLVVFPELSLTGYPAEDLLLSPAFVADADLVAIDLAARLPSTTVLVGSCHSTDSGVTNGIHVMRGGKIETTYAKCLLPNYGVFDEQRYFVSGDGGAVITVKDCTVGLSICEDIWEAEGPTVDCARLGADLIVNCSASPFHAGKSEERLAVLRERASEHGLPILYCALVGGQDEVVFDGSSIVVDSTGKIVGRAKQFDTDTLIVETAALEDTRLEPLLEGTAEVEGALHLGLRDYVDKNGFAGVVFGLSGGIDSAVVATLAVDALGRDRVQAAVMSSPWSSLETQDDARTLASNLGIPLYDLGIQAAMDAYEMTLGDAGNGPGRDLALENIQARIRGNLLMALSNTHGWLVLTTGNKSELAVGYSTLYGDAAGGFGLIKDVPKGAVYDLAALRNSLPDAPIPASIIERAPSAELRPGQKDEDSLPPYSRLDEILRLHVEERLDLDQIAAAGFDRAEVERILLLVDRSEYKRRQYPPGVKITPLAFGRDRRMPMTNRWRSQGGSSPAS